MIDSHCHLNFHAFEDNYREVVKRAKTAGVEAIICPSTYLEASEQALKLADEFPSWVYPAVGHHPSHVKDHVFDITAYHKLASDPRVVAIGEIGLDAHRDEAKAQLSDQIEMLRAQLDLAHEVNKPVILHSRAAYQELLNLLESLPYKLEGVVHCFEGSQAQAEEFLQLGLYVGFTGMVTYPKNDSLRSIAATIPLDRILVETDSPFLPPQSHRGEQNKPAFVVEVVETIAAERKMEIAEFDKITTENARRLFKI